MLKSECICGKPKKPSVLHVKRSLSPWHRRGDLHVRRTRSRETIEYMLMRLFAYCREYREGNYAQRRCSGRGRTSGSRSRSQWTHQRLDRGRPARPESVVARTWPGEQRYTGADSPHRMFTAFPTSRFIHSNGVLLMKCRDAKRRSSLSLSMTEQELDLEIGGRKFAASIGASSGLVASSVSQRKMTAIVDQLSKDSAALDPERLEEPL